MNHHCHPVYKGEPFTPGALGADVNMAEHRAFQCIDELVGGNVALQPKHLSWRDDGVVRSVQQQNRSLQESQMAGRRGSCQFFTALLNLGQDLGS